MAPLEPDMPTISLMGRDRSASSDQDARAYSSAGRAGGLRSRFRGQLGACLLRRWHAARQSNSSGLKDCTQAGGFALRASRAVCEEFLAPTLEDRQGPWLRRALHG